MDCVPTSCCFVVILLHPSILVPTQPEPFQLADETDMEEPLPGWDLKDIFSNDLQS